MTVVPAAPFRRVIEDWFDRNPFSGPYTAAWRTGLIVNRNLITEIREGKREVLHFDCTTPGVSGRVRTATACRIAPDPNRGARR